MLSTESGFSERVYLIAAQDRMTLVNKIMEGTAPDYVIASYLTGVAVECLFHAYRMRSGVDDTAKHDLRIHADITRWHLYRIEGNRTTRQNALYFNADKIVEAANQIITTGVVRWTR